jgi:hypothetical protein
MSDIARGPRIAVVGSCQVSGIGGALLKLCPNAEVKAWHMGVTKESKEDIAAQLGRYDLIVSQVKEANPNSVLALQRLQEAHANVFYIPTLVFNGFHPDCIYATLRGQFVVGPLSRLQSGIVAAAFLLNVPEKSVSRLFNALTYACLGYFEAFEVARSLMLKSYSEAGFDLAPYVDSWKATGSFMHTLNHPKIHVLAQFAHMIGVRAGFIEEATSLPNDVEDVLAEGIRWPVYPEIARNLGLERSKIVFKMATRDVDLATAVPQFYEFYRGFDRADLQASIPARLLEGLGAALST